MWVILNFFPYSPVHVYGLFDNETAAREYAERHGMAIDENSYQVVELRNVEEA